jgi:hypothetical protein
MPVLTEPNTLGDGIKWEESNDYSREKVTVLSGQNLALLEVVGKVKVAVPTTGTATGGNTGTGLCTSVVGGLRTIAETFTLKCITAVGNAGVFSVIGSKTGRLADAVVAVPYTSDYIGFTLTDATDFIVGDSFTIVVAEGSGKVVALDPDGVNGANHAAGIMIAAVDASLADKTGVAIVREAMIATANLVWPTGISAGDKAIAIADLAALGIVAVETA